ncbi:penicillin acylase family protein [Luteimonas sp. S4-F44]|uniref:penicillin acylase family protein n=1 Tax=Luteimonas sp. S4-F44 TaxID=2925842 RepID=UPI001F52E47B|nr:penicillin acylase family protein [Luteimonas sp. S4-F44]UNK43540.1 penicillin acylase family protein [Luteimonas sp. S4-F44]
MRNRWRAWSLRALLALAVVALAIVAMLWWQLRGSLPDLAGTRTLPGLEAPATIQRDALGTVTITADSETDAMRALGWVHAQERYFEMDLMRRLPAGELSALFGERALDTDRRHRLHRMRARVDATLAEVAGARMPQLRAYAEGANAGLAALRARPWPYLLLRQPPAPWTPADSALVGFSMYFDLQDAGNARELTMHRLGPRLPPALLALVAHDGSRWDAPLEGAARGDATLPDADAVDLRRLDVTDAGDVGGPPAAMAWEAPSPPLAPAAADLGWGSNNFAVGGALTTDGRALVADDMHLGLRAPNLWFRARLRYPDARAPGGRVDITGFTLPGLPAVIVGSNGHIAWGFTNSYIDTLDWQRIVPCDAAAAQAPGCTPLRRHTETIAVAGRAAEVLTVDDSDWGPVVHREVDGGALALRWTAHLPSALNFGLADFAHARDLDDALAIADRTATPTQNLVIGDLHGAVAWRLLGPVPVRAPGCNGRTVSHSPRAGAMSGDAGNVCAPWPIATDASPIVRTPDAMRLWTANSRVVDGADFARLGDGGAALGIRAWQIRQGLDARVRFGERDLLAIQLDDRALLLTQWQGLLVRAADAAGTDATALRALADAAADWRGRAAVDSVAYRIVRAWRLAVHARIADGLLAPARTTAGDAIAWPDPPNFEGVVWPLVSQRPEHLLPRRFACTPQTQQGRCAPVADGWTALLEDAAREVRDTLQAEGALAQRTWGEHNTAAICHPLAAAIPFVGRRALCMPAQPLPGDGTVPRVQAPAFGASQRMVVAPGHEADGIAHMPGGQSGHPLSPFWGAGHDDWVQGRASPFLPGTATHVLQLQPAHRAAPTDSARRD